MAEMTIALRCNPNTGKKDIIISLRSEADALPHEHEQQHRTLVNKLLNGGILKEGEVGDLIVERKEEDAIPPLTSQEPPQKQAIGHGH